MSSVGWYFGELVKQYTPEMYDYLCIIMFLILVFLFIYVNR